MTSVVVKLLVVVGGTAVLGAVGLGVASTAWQRTILIGFLAGCMLYSGVGAAYPSVPWDYLVYYFGLVVAFVVAFRFFCTVLAGLSRQAGRVLPNLLAGVDRSSTWGAVAWLYLVLHVVPLLYPENRLHLLFSPPSPDLTSVWATRWQSQEPDVLLKLLQYVMLLLKPFFYVTLYRFRNRMLQLIVMQIAILYLQYVSVGYIGRGDVLLALVLVWLAIWVYRPRRRPALVVTAVIGLPVILVVSYVYGVVRIGGEVGDVSLWDAMLEIVETETSFPRDVGMPIIESGHRVDMMGYIRWIATLPIPKILTGEIPGARVNYEISQYVLGVGPGEPGWYVVLPGLVAESVYIYGPYFFWLHGFFVAFWAALVTRLVERTPQLLFLACQYVLLFAYVLNRGGIAALLPVVTNEFMLFYVFVLLGIVGFAGRRLMKMTARRKMARR